MATRRPPGHGGSAAGLRSALGAALLLCVPLGASSDAISVVSDYAALEAAVAAGGSHLVTDNITFPAAGGSLWVNSTFNASLALTGSCDDGQSCVLDALNRGGHFVVPPGFSLSLNNLVLANGGRGGDLNELEQCLGLKEQEGTDPLGLPSLAQAGCTVPPKPLLEFLETWGDANTLCGRLQCGTVVVAANASLHVNRCSFVSNTGWSDGTYYARGSAISIVATAGFTITDSLFVGNSVKSTYGSLPHAGGAVAVMQPFNSLQFVSHDGTFPPMLIQNTTFQHNLVYGLGGALYSQIGVGTLSVLNCTFDSNTAFGMGTATTGLGGAVAVNAMKFNSPFQGADTSFRFANLNAFYWTDAFDTNPPDVEHADFALHAHYNFADTAFTNNAALPLLATVPSPTAGGALYFGNGGYGATLTRCNLTSNTASRGGAIYYRGQSVESVLVLDDIGLHVIPHNTHGVIPSDYQLNNGLVTTGMLTQSDPEYEFHRWNDADYLALSSVNADYNSLAPVAQASGYMVSLVDCSIDNNTATFLAPETAGRGGAVYIACGALSASGTSFVSNVALAGTGFSAGLGSYGGAVYASNECPTPDLTSFVTTNLTLLNSVFRNNSAASDGGAVAVKNFDPSAQQSAASILVSATGTTFDSNRASPSVGRGGALFGDSFAVLTLASCTAVSNQASAGGAVHTSGTLSASQTSFSGNTAAHQGGALFVTGSAALAVVNFTANRATVGGALFVGGVSSLDACLLASNAAINGSALAVAAGSSTNVSSTTIIREHAATQFGTVFVSCPPALLALAALFSSNTAQAGGSVFYDATDTSNVAVPGSGDNQAVANYGPKAASVPAAAPFAINGRQSTGSSAVTLKSGAPLSLVFNLMDGFGQVVDTWLDAAFDVSCTAFVSVSGAAPRDCPPEVLRGTVHAAYFDGSSFVVAKLFAAVGASALLTATLQSPTVPILLPPAGLSYTINVTISQCAPLETFDDGQQLCVCAAGAFLRSSTDGNAASCTACPRGTFSAVNAVSCTLCPAGWLSNDNLTGCIPCPAGTFLNASAGACSTCPLGSNAPQPGASSCNPNPPGYVSTTQTTMAANLTLAGVSASNFTASARLALAASLAATLGVPVGVLNVTSVVDAPLLAGRRLLAASAVAAYTVTTTHVGLTSSLRTILSNTTALGTTLMAAFQRSADPALSQVTGVAPATATEVSLVLAAEPCPAGTYLDGLSQQCQTCQSPLVTTSIGSSACEPCPPRSAWASAAQCAPCPSNSILSPSNPTLCACQPGYYDTLYGANFTAPVCAPCPLGGACETGAVAAAAGWWREDTRSAVFYRCRVDVCIAENITGPLSAEQQPLPPAGRSSENCVAGNTGPLCAVCKDGYAMQSGECAPCAAEDSWDSWSQSSKAGLLASCIVVCLVALAFAFLQPVWPSLERATDAALQAAANGARRAADVCSACYRRCCCRGPALVEPAAATGTKAAPPFDNTTRVATPVSATHGEAPGAVPVVHHHHTRRIDVQAVQHSLASNAAFAIGNVAAFVAEVDGGAEEEDTAAAGEVSRVERHTDFLDRVEEFVLQFKAAMKIFVNFFQIASTLLKSVDVPWPRVFGAAMSRISLINLNLVELPAAACLHPSPSYYSTFNGYTLGLLAALGLSAVIWQLGKHVVAPLALQGFPEEERKARLARLNSTALARALLVLYLVYPGVSVAIFAVFTCTTFESGDSFLDADARITCYDSVHKRYMAGAAVWLVLIPFGVPAFFLWLLRRFKVPQMAALLADNALLQEAIKLAWAEGLAQPADAGTLTVDSISTLHLEALFAFFLHDVSAEDAAEILAGTRPPAFAHVADANEEPLVKEPLSARFSLGAHNMFHRLSGTMSRLAGVKSAVSKRIVLINSVAAKVAGQDEGDTRRTLVLMSVLTHFRTTGDVAVPPLVWEQLTEDVPQLMDAAMSEVSFLFAAYRMECWYWEVVELIRKLALTSILALIAPGSAGQVVVGILISFTTLIATLVMSPYAQKRLNLIGQVAQLHLFFLLFVALLLKLNVDGEQDGDFFGGIVIAVCTVPVILPFAMRLYLRFVGGGLEARALVRDAAW